MRGEERLRDEASHRCDADPGPPQFGGFWATSPRQPIGHSCQVDSMPCKWTVEARALPNEELRLIGAVWRTGTRPSSGAPKEIS